MIMSDKEYFDDKITRFIKGEMNSEEEQEFLSLLKRDPALRNKAISIARLTKGLQVVGKERDHNILTDIKATDKHSLENISSEITGKKRKGNIFLRISAYISVAACIAICIIGGIKYHAYTETVNLGMENLTYFQSSEFMRGEKNEVSSQLESIYASLEARDNIKENIKILNGLWEKSLEETYNDYTIYMPEIGWMLANAYLMDNKKSEAKKILSVLSEEYPEGTEFGDKVRELIFEIEEI